MQLITKYEKLFTHPGFYGCSLNIFFRLYTSHQLKISQFTKRWSNKLKNSLERKNKAAVNFKTERFDNVDSAVIISSVCKAVQNCKL